MSALSKIATPINYIRICHPEKRVFDLWIPALASISIGLFLLFLDKPIAILSKDGLVSVVNGILQILSGFYIASMAAVATFQKDGMDDLMDGTPPTLKGVSLTRRKFLTYLFGYLAFSSILLYFIGGGLQLLAPTIAKVAWINIALVKQIFVTIYLFIVMNILCTTVLGMHFMIDKMHDNKIKVTLNHVAFDEVQDSHTDQNGSDNKRD
ncbi:hypothetical protein [Yersinia bercovieri]|uniref:hypothetical protein n=1 Tax=Yersinia bercovieri TaxID=634 RepID=UPI0011A51299|nr:hypothetical protein [Yersinia bercovieri]